MRWIDYGLGGLDARALDLVGRTSETSRPLPRLAAAGELCGYEVDERFYEIGTPTGLAETDTFLEADATKLKPRRTNTDAQASHGVASDTRTEGARVADDDRLSLHNVEVLAKHVLDRAERQLQSRWVVHQSCRCDDSQRAKEPPLDGERPSRDA